MRYSAIFLFLLMTLLPLRAQYRVVDGQIFRGGERIHLMGVNWFGFETDVHIAHGIWSRSYVDIIAQIKSLGFNAVRLPFSADTVANAAVPQTAINAGANPDLLGLGSLEVLDKVVAEFDRQGIHMLLDFHSISGRDHTWDLWYDDNSSEEDWIQALGVIAARYADTSYVMGIDLKNEPHGVATWGTGATESDWKRASEAAATAVMAVNENVLIFVEGVETNPVCSDNSNNIWWGGNLQPMACFPPDIPADRLVLSPHVYGPDVFAQPYFSDANFPENMPTIWDTHFGFAKDSGYVVAPGEFGGKYGNGLASDVIWQDKIVDYFIDKQIFDFFYWSWNPNSGDTEGIVQDDWTTVNEAKFNNLKRLIDAATADLQGEPGNRSPSISITAPINGSRIEGPASVTVEATASDVDGTVTGVEFFLNGELVGSDTTSPYAVTTVVLAVGDYQLTARATDNAGAQRTSGVTMIEVFDPDFVPPAGDLVVEYRDASSSVSGQDVKPQLRIVNNGTESVSLSELTVRYWFTTDSAIGNMFTCDYAQVGAANVTGQFSPFTPSLANADTFLEVGFSAAAGAIAAGGNSGEVQIRVNKQNFSNYDQSNDYSYDGAVTSFAPVTSIALYRSGVLIYGAEPGSSADMDSDNDGLPNSYEETYGLDTTIDDSELDLDGDGVKNIDEFIAGTAPNDRGSRFRVLGIDPTEAGMMEISWSSVSGRLYTLQSTSDLSQPFTDVGTEVNATPPMNRLVLPAGGTRNFFRVAVRRE